MLSQKLAALSAKLKLAAPDGTVRLDLNVRPLAVAFGNDPEVLKQASPLTHVREGLPPMLLLNAGWDYAPLKRMAKEFAAAPFYLITLCLAVERLMDFLTALGHDIEISVTPTRKERGKMSLSVGTR